MQSLDAVPEHLRPELMAKIEHLQLAESTRMYNDLVEMCFARCVNSFPAKALEPAEDKCLNDCVTKFMNVSKRIGARWQEFQAGQNEQAMISVQSMAAAAGVGAPGSAPVGPAARR